MQRLAAATIGLAVETAGETGQLFLHGNSERELEEAVSTHKLSGIEVQAGNPQIAYLETLMRPVTIDHFHQMTAAFPADSARVVLLFEPQNTGVGNVFTSEVPPSVMTVTQLAAIKRGVHSSWRDGPLLGMRVAGMKVTVLEVGIEAGSDPERALEIAARMAIKEVSKNGAMRILEPIMSVEVVTPEDFTGSCILDMNSRRGQILGQSAEPDGNRLSCEAPLGNLFGYASTLRSMTNGRASCSMTYSHHDLMPNNIAPDDPQNFPPAIGMRA